LGIRAHALPFWDERLDVFSAWPLLEKEKENKYILEIMQEEPPNLALICFVEKDLHQQLGQLGFFLCLS